MSVERYLVHVNGVTAETDEGSGAPTPNPLSWAGQLELVEDPYTAHEDRKIETGFRGRTVEVVRDEAQS